MTSTPLSLDDLKRFRGIVETGTPLDKRTVLNIISHAGQLQEHFDEALAANQALVEQLARVNPVGDLLGTRAGLALASGAFSEGMGAAIDACNKSDEGEPFVRPLNPYSAALLAMIKADRSEES